MLNLTTAASEIKANTTLVYAEGNGYIGEVQPIGSLFRAVDFAGNILTPPRTYRQAFNVFKTARMVVKVNAAN